MNRIVFALAAVVAVSGPAAGEPDLPGMAVADFKAALPDYAIEKVDALTLKAGPPGHLDYEIRLDRIAAFCRENADRCETVLHDYVAKFVAAIKEQDAPPDVGRLRATVRAAAYVAGMQREMASYQKDAALITAPLAGDLVAVCFFDLPTTMRPVTTKDLAALHLTADGAMAACLKNVGAALKPLGEEWRQDDSKIPFHVLAGQEYESSYILFPQLWSELAAKFGGALIVAVPEQGIILYGPESGSEAVGLLHKIAVEGARTAERPISTKVLRWTPKGWEPAEP